LIVPKGGSESCCPCRISSGRARTLLAMSSNSLSSNQRVIRRPLLFLVQCCLIGQPRHFAVA
jgi:hypothetical protein